ncbi:unnamed protein product, partial [Rotaria sp. Silwood2]
MISLRCVTFGTPQCADYHFWSSYTEWYGIFDTYIYEHDAIFRLATFGADVTRKIINASGTYIRKLGIKICSKLIGYQSEDLTSVLLTASDEICDICHDGLIPTYSIFGRHHFIRKDKNSELKIISIGEGTHEKQQILQYLVAGRP